MDNWLDLDAATASHLMLTAQRIGSAIQSAFEPTRVGMMIAGLEVPHVHVHVTQLNHVNDLDFARADRFVTEAGLDEAAASLQAALKG